MDPDLVLIFGFIIVVTAIVMSMITRVSKHAMDLKHRQLELRAGASGGPASQVAARLDNFEERLRVLERIATDDRQGTALAAEIEALRLDAGTPLVMPTRTEEKAQ